MNSQNQHQGYEAGTYVLTCDLATRIRALRQIGIKTPEAEDPVFVRFHNELVRRIKAGLPNDHLRVIKMDDLADKILAVALMKKTSLKRATVVSSCVEIAAPRRGHTIEINRIIDKDGRIIGWGPRPGHPTLDEQLDAITTVPQPVVLVEDGSFSGRTLAHVLNKMKRRSIEVEAVVVGLGFPEALKTIREEFGGEIIVVEHLDRLIDWMPDHDFMPFTPNCGRIFGFPMNGDALPFYTYNGASYSVPYILPFCPVKEMGEWTSIPQKDCMSISLFCLQSAIELFFLLEQLNERQIKIGDLMGVQPAISIPIALGQQTFPRLDERVVDYLTTMCRRGL